MLKISSGFPPERICDSYIYFVSFHAVLKQSIAANIQAAHAKRTPEHTNTYMHIRTLVYLCRHNTHINTHKYINSYTNACNTWIRKTHEDAGLHRVLPWHKPLIRIHYLLFMSLTSTEFDSSFSVNILKSFHRFLWPFALSLSRFLPWHSK